MVWTNADRTRHTVTPAGADLDFGGELQGGGGALIGRFDKPGTFGFFCSVHSHMAGAVIVS